MGVSESKWRTPSESQQCVSFLNRGSVLFKLPLYFKQAGTMLPFLDIPLKMLFAASTWRRKGLQEEKRKGRRMNDADFT